MTIHKFYWGNVCYDKYVCVDIHLEVRKQPYVWFSSIIFRQKSIVCHSLHQTSWPLSFPWFSFTSILLVEPLSPNFVLILTMQTQIATNVWTTLYKLNHFLYLKLAFKDISRFWYIVFLFIFYCPMLCLMNILKWQALLRNISTLHVSGKWEINVERKCLIFIICMEMSTLFWKQICESSV